MTKIKCKNCNREIEKKGNRELCIKCTNQRQNENARRYRERKKEAA